MPLPVVSGEYGIVSDINYRISEKGNKWAKIRAVAKDRVRDSNGTWSDGDPMFIDIIVSGATAENLTESVCKGDSIVVSGKLKQREYEVDGVKKQNYYIDADFAGVSVRWGHARTQKTIDWMGTPKSVAEQLGATDITPEASPF